MHEHEMERIAGALGSKAAKIRALNEAGASTSEISSFLGIRYQHTYNVLLRAGRIGKAEPAKVVDLGEIVTLDVQAGGSVVLPKQVLRSLGIESGGQLLCRPTADGLLLMPRDQAIAELQRLAMEHMPEHASLFAALLGNKP